MSSALHSLIPDTSGSGACMPEWRRAASRALHPSARMVDDDSLTAIAEGLAQVTLPWELRTGDAPSGRRYERVLATPGYDAWVIYWPPGFELELHDHGGSWGAYSVVAGELDEVAVVDGQLVAATLLPGHSVQFGPDHVHAVVNRSACPATSVHVYSPPLSSMAFFETCEDGSLTPVREERGGWEDGE